MQFEGDVFKRLVLHVFHSATFYDFISLPWATQQFTEIAVTGHLTFFPIPEMIWDIYINLCQLSYSFQKAVTVAIF